MNCKTVGFALALSVISFAAVAQSTTPQKPGDAPSTASSEARAKYRAACASDIQKFCANVERAKGAMRLVAIAFIPGLSGSGPEQTDPRRIILPLDKGRWKELVDIRINASQSGLTSPTQPDPEKK